MPYLEPDETDPLFGVGVATPGTIEDVVEMAYALAEEYASTGGTREELLELFRSAEHVIPHHAYEVLGEERIRVIADECVSLFGRVRFVVKDNPDLDLVQIGGLRGLGSGRPEDGMVGQR